MSSQQPESGDSSQEKRTNAADALDAMARGEQAYAADDDAPAEETAAADVETGEAVEAADAWGYDASVAGDEVVEAADPADALGGIAAESAAPSQYTPSRPPVRRPAGPSSHGLAMRRIGIPVMLAMALFMFVIGTIAVLILAGVDVLGNDSSNQRTRTASMVMLLSWPVAIFLVIGCYFFWKDLTAAKRRGSR